MLVETDRQNRSPLTSVGNDYEESSYYDQCGWRQYIWGNVTRKKFLFSASNVSKAYKHAGHGDAFHPEVDTVYKYNIIIYVIQYICNI